MSSTFVLSFRIHCVSLSFVYFFSILFQQCFSYAGVPIHPHIPTERNGCHSCSKLYVYLGNAISRFLLHRFMLSDTFKFYSKLFYGIFNLYKLWKIELPMRNEYRDHQWRRMQCMKNKWIQIEYRRNFDCGTKCTTKWIRRRKEKPNTHTHRETCQINISMPFRFTKESNFSTWTLLLIQSQNIAGTLNVVLFAFSFLPYLSLNQNSKCAAISDKVGRISSLQMSFVSVFPMRSQTSQILLSLPFVSEQLKINFRKFFDTLNARKTQIIR